MNEEKKVSATALLRDFLGVVQDAQARIKALEGKVEMLTDIVAHQSGHVDALIADARLLEERLDVLARFNNARIPSTFWLWFSKWAGLR